MKIKTRVVAVGVSLEGTPFDLAVALDELNIGIDYADFSGLLSEFNADDDYVVTEYDVAHYANYDANFHLDRVFVIYPLWNNELTIVLELDDCSCKVMVKEGK